MTRKAYSHFHPLASDKLHATHHIFLHFDQDSELLREVWAECASGRFAECMTYTTGIAAVSLCIKIKGNRIVKSVLLSHKAKSE